MSRFFHGCLALAAGYMLTGCGAPTPPKAQVTAAIDPKQELSRTVEYFWEEDRAFGGAIDEQALADELALERRYLEQLLRVPRERLDEEGKLTYDIFKRRRELATEGFTYPEELLPLHPFHGLPLTLALSALESAQRPWSAADCDAWLNHVDAYVSFADSSVQNLRDGLRRGYLTPRSVVERMIKLLERLGEEGDANVFYTPLNTLSDKLNAADRARFAKRLKDAVSEKILPATHRLHDYLKQEYLPKARSSLSLTEEPLGAAWYAFRLKRAIGADYRAQDIHRQGLAEIERLKARLQPARAAEPKPVSELLAGYQDLSTRVSAASGSQFPDMPATPFEIQATDFVLQPGSPLSYWRVSTVSARPGVLYIDPHAQQAKPDVASFLKYAIPGVHYLSAALIQSQLPKFRRYGAETAFLEGWGMYAAGLGEELGLYTDEESRQQWLELQLHCAAALVADTGVHAMGWTRAQALDYLHTQALLEENDAQAVLDAVATSPGDGAACLIGAQKFQALRARAQQALGSHFSLQEFHAHILRDGAMPLDMLDARNKAWVESAR